jgi:phage/plasmid-associated DNA primase
MLGKSMNMSNFGRVLTTCIYDKKKENGGNGFSKIPIHNEEEYIKEFEKRNKSGGFCELVGLEEYQVKPYFDIDPKGEFEYSRIDEMKEDIKEIIGDVPIYQGRRDPRKENEKLKHSIRLYVKARITYTNIPILFKDLFIKYADILDKGIYNPNRRLYLPLSDEKRGVKVPPLKVIDGSLLDCSATYIEEDYEDLDAKMPKIETKKETFKEEFERLTKKLGLDNDEDEDENPNKYNRLTELIKLLSSKRSDDFDSWIKMAWCIINITNKEKIPRRKCYDLIHQFSKLSTTNYNEDQVDDWIDKNFDKVKEAGYGWKYLIHTCIKEDNPKYYETISKSYYNMKKEFELNNAKILYPPMVVHIDRNGENIIQPIPLCEKTNRHIKCSIKETNKKGETAYKDKRFIEMWLDDPKIRKYDNYVFKPFPLKVEEYEYNTWTDFEITKTEYEEDQTVIDRLLDYMKNLFNNDEVVKYILAYFANRIQNPAIRNMVCIILYGEEGDGKNRLFDIFKNLIGDKYYTELENAKQMFGTHSCIEKEKLFICVNEAKGKDNYENSETLKARITTDRLIVNPKGIQEFKIDNFCDYIMTTNNANAVNLHDKSRRYLYVETTSYYSRNSEFFNKFSNDIVDNPKALRVIYEYLMKFDVKSVIPSGNFQNHIPETEIQKDIIKNNRDKVLYFLEDLINEPKYTLTFDDDDDTKEFKIKNSDVFAEWKLWITKNNIKCEYNNIAFHSRLGQLMKKKINLQDTIIRKDTHQNTYIKLEKMREFFIKLNE